MPNHATVIVTVDVIKALFTIDDIVDLILPWVDPSFVGFVCAIPVLPSLSSPSIENLENIFPSCGRRLGHGRLRARGRERLHGVWAREPLRTEGRGWDELGMGFVVRSIR